MFVGRSDFQVKIRGYRIELGEIDAVLLTHPLVVFASTVGHEMPSGQTALVAYVQGGAGLVPAELSEHVARSLPSYMVPSQIIVLDEVPLTPVGKLDRSALPEPEFGLRYREFRAPTTPVEESVARVFADVLGVQDVGLDDDFFELGGNSLLATQVVSRLGAILDTQVPVRALFDAGTVAALAVRVEREAGRGERVPLARTTRPERIPLSPAQQRMWFLNRFDPESGANNIPVGVRLTGDLDVKALRTALRDVVERHESLRTVYPDVDGAGHQSILPPYTVELPVERVDESALFDRAEQLTSEGFDVTREVPLRVVLFTLGAREHVLFLVVHHIAADGFSLRPLARDIMLAYANRSRGEAPAWAPLEVQYADYASGSARSSVRKVTRTRFSPGRRSTGPIGWRTCPTSSICRPIVLARRWRPTPAARAGSGSSHSCTLRWKSWPGNGTRRCSWSCMRHSQCCWPGCPARRTSPSAPRSPVAASVHWTTSWACSSTRSCSASTCGTIVPSTTCSGRCGRPISTLRARRRPLRTARRDPRSSAVTGPSPAVPGGAHVPEHR